MTTESQKKVINYYTRIGSKWGYDLVLGGVKHFGYYPNGQTKISEPEAQDNLHNLIAQKLNLKSTDQVLDAGCGQGIVSSYFAKQYGCQVIGITIVPFEIKKAQRHAQQLGVLDKTQYHLMDYSKLDFPDNHFDAIYTVETLSHSPNIRQTLSELYRVLKPDGRFVFCEYTLAPDEQFNDHEYQMLDLVIEGSTMMGLKDFRHNKFSGVLSSIGFRQVNEQNASKNIEPSMHRLNRIAKLPYYFISLFHLRKYFINSTAAIEYYKFLKKDLWRYCIFSGHK